jgi:glycosyltransferase involved in cell wall biosynthesis
MFELITPMILTWDEAPNIRRTLDKLSWARRIVVIDSGSTDETLQLVRAYPQVEVIQHAFLDFASQCNFGLTQIVSRWVLSLDADYELSDDLVRELKVLAPPDKVAGYRARFIYRIRGCALRGTLYPPRTVLYRNGSASYRNEGHGHRVTLQGKVLDLHGVIYHDDRKPLSRWLASQQSYARLEADYLLKTDERVISTSDRVRRMAWPAPILVFFYVLVVKGCLFDGWPGWFYTMQRVLAECMIALELIDRRLRRVPSRGDRQGAAD